MRYARASLFYLATYLSLTGLAFLFRPQCSLDLLGTNRSYDAPFVQFSGAFMLALAIIVIQIIRWRLEVLHTTTVFVRLFFLAVIAWLFLSTREPLFAAIFGVVTLGCSAHCVRTRLGSAVAVVMTPAMDFGSHCNM